jgi:hypothetical protein
MTKESRLAYASVTLSLVALILVEYCHHIWAHQGIAIVSVASP